MSNTFYFVSQNRYLIQITSDENAYYCLANENIKENTAAYEVERFTVNNIYDLQEKQNVNQLGEFEINKYFCIDDNHSEYHKYCVAYKSLEAALSRLHLNIYVKYFPDNKDKVFKTYYHNGHLCEEYEYLNDQKHGTYTLYFSDGTIREHKTYINNVEQK